MPKPRKGEPRKKYIKRCIRYRQKKEGQSEPVKQSVAICYSMYNQAKKKRKRQRKKK